MAKRSELFERDNNKCFLCGATCKLEIHHIEPVRNGVNNLFINLITLCTKCHSCHGETDNNKNIFKEYTSQAKWKDKKLSTSGGHGYGYKAIRIPKEDWVRVELLAINEMKQGKRSGVATILRRWIKQKTK